MLALVGSIPATIAGWDTTGLPLKLFRVPQIPTGAPRTSVRGPKTMGEAHHSLLFRIYPLSSRGEDLLVALLAPSPPPIDGCPILRALREGWASQISPFTFHKRRHKGKRIHFKNNGLPIRCRRKLRAAMNQSRRDGTACSPARQCRVDKAHESSPGGTAQYAAVTASNSLPFLVGKAR